MSTLTNILDRLTDILVKEQNDIRSMMLQQQRDLAEVRGQLKAMIQMQSANGKLRLK